MKSPIKYYEIMEQPQTLIDDVFDFVCDNFVRETEDLLNKFYKYFKKKSENE